MQNYTPSQAVLATRIVSHGKIDSLAEDFSLPGNLPFSVYVRGKADTGADDVLISVKAIQDQDFSECPFPAGDWSPVLLESIKADADLLESYDIYWGCGYYVPQPQSDGGNE